MRVILHLAAVLAAILPSWAAQASVAVALSVEQLTARSDLVVQAHVLSQESHWTRGGRIITTVHLAVENALKGQAPAEVTVMHLGGHVDDIGQQVSGEVSFTPGEEVVVFLRQRPHAAAVFQVVGMSQGKFHISRSGQRIVASQALKGLGLVVPSGKIEDRAGQVIPLAQLRARISRAAAP